MASDAERVPLDVEFSTVGLVAVGADDPLCVHTALKEGSMHIDFIEDLAIGVVKSGIEQAQQVSLG